MLGAIVGDMAGSIYEFNNIKTKDFEILPKDCYFTDDTVMTLAIADVLSRFDGNQDIVESDFTDMLANYMRGYGNKYPGAGYGGMFHIWINDPTVPAYNSFGNGSAMRVSSIPWYFQDLAKVEKYAELSASVTHNHPEGIKGAKATAAAIFLARTGYSKQYIRDYITNTYGYDLDRTIDGIRPTYRFYETCQKTVPEAIIAFLDGNDFEDCLRNAISLGGDSDTLAAITCSIAEGMYDIPKDIQNRALAKLDQDQIYVLYKFDECLANKVAL